MNLSPSTWIETIETYLSQTKGWLAMHNRVKALEARVAALEASRTSEGPVCDQCGSPDIKRTGTRNSPGPFGALGLKESVYRCNACQAESYIELPMP